MIKIRNLKSILIGGMIITITGISAYMVKSMALEREQAVQLLQAQINEEKDRITVLEADWSLLTSPDRIQGLAIEMLSFAPIEPSRILTLDAFGEPQDDEDPGSKFFHIKTITGVE